MSQFINLGKLSYNLAGFVKVKIYHCKYNSVMLSNFINKNQFTGFFLNITGQTVLLKMKNA